MELQDERQYEVTRAKLRMLQEEYEAARTQRSTDEHVRELTLRSPKKLINQLTEEIVRYDCRRSADAANH